MVIDSLRSMSSPEVDVLRLCPDVEGNDVAAVADRVRHRGLGSDRVGNRDPP